MTVTINGTTGIAGTNGSAGTPAVQGEDTNTGIFFPAADTVAVATGGAERLRVTSAGNVGIGATSPSKKLHLAGTAGSSAILLAKTDSGASTLGQIGFSTVNGTVAGIDATSVTDSNNGALRFWTTGGSPQSDVTSLLERARIDSSGNLLVGTTSTIASGGVGASVVADAGGAYIARRTNTTSANGAVYFYNPNGIVGNIQTSGSSTSYVTSSDYRLKENVAPMQNALDTVAQLNPVTYTWKADGSAGQGFIAHELQAVVPDCVTGEKDAVDAEGNPQYQGVDTSFLVATLVKAIQELTARVAELEAK